PQLTVLSIVAFQRLVNSQVTWHHRVQGSVCDGFREFEFFKSPGVKFEDFDNMASPNSALQRRPLYDFVSPPPKEFTCSICTEVLYDPVETTVCDHVYCRECLTDWLQRSSTCPECRTPATTASLKTAHRLLRNFLGSLKVYCPHAYCNDVTTVEELEEHTNKCSSSKIRCEKGCEQLLLKSELRVHDCVQHLKALVDQLQPEHDQAKDRIASLQAQEETARKKIEEQEQEIQNQTEIIRIMRHDCEEHLHRIEAYKLRISELEAVFGGGAAMATTTATPGTNLADSSNASQSAQLVGATAAWETNFADFSKFDQSNSIVQRPEITQTASALTTEKFTFDFTTSAPSALSSQEKLVSRPAIRDGFSFQIILYEYNNYLSLGLISRQLKNSVRSMNWSITFQLRLRSGKSRKPRTFTRNEALFSTFGCFQGIYSVCEWIGGETVTVEATILSLRIYPEKIRTREIGVHPDSFETRFPRVIDMEPHDVIISECFQAPRLEELLYQEFKYSLMIERKLNGLHLGVVGCNPDKISVLFTILKDGKAVLKIRSSKFTVIRGIPWQKVIDKEAGCLDDDGSLVVKMSYFST
ncbi:unnamed protein product, partial [Cyprideis torosa]